MSIEEVFQKRWGQDYWETSPTIQKHYQSLNQKLFLESIERLVSISASDMANTHKRAFAMKALTEVKVAEKRGDLNQTIDRLRLELRKL